MPGLGHFPIIEDPDSLRGLVLGAVKRCLSQNS
jgi:hypothetical protein